MRVNVCAAVFVVISVCVCCGSTAWSQEAATAILRVRVFSLPTERNPVPKILVNEPISVQVFRPHYVNGQIKRIASDRIQEERSPTEARVSAYSDTLTTNHQGEIKVKITLRKGLQSELFILELKRADLSGGATQRIDGLILTANQTLHLPVSVPKPLEVSSLSHSTCSCRHVKCFRKPRCFIFRRSRCK